MENNFANSATFSCAMELPVMVGGDHHTCVPVVCVFRASIASDNVDHLHPVERLTVASSNKQKQLARAVGNAADSGIQDDLRFQRRLVRRGYPGELADAPASCQSIQAFDVPTLTDFKWTLAIDFNEVWRADDPPCPLTVIAGGRNQCHDRNLAGLENELGEFCDPPDIFSAILRLKAEIATQA